MFYLVLLYPEKEFDLEEETQRGKTRGRGTEQINNRDHEVNWRLGKYKNIFLKQMEEKKGKQTMTPTWVEHAAFWSGVRRATIAPRSQVRQDDVQSTSLYTFI